ncbi:MAG: hypothetical protein U9R58_12950 [Chloroflexota bacterium]|nr:hypothetical protein [Chloroflexota bacterium]
MENGYTVEDINKDQARPSGVIVITLLCIISAAIGIIEGLRGLGLLGPLELRPGGPFVLPVVFMGATMLVLSVILLGVAVGLWMLKGWAWTGAVTIAVVRLLGDLIFFITGGLGYGNLGLIVGASGMGFNLIILFYLMRGNVKEAFGK